MAFSLKLKKKIRFSSPLSDQSIFPSSWSVPIDSDQEAGKYSWKFHKNLKIFWGVSSIFSDQWSKWLSTWSVSSRIRENLSHFYVHKMTTINHCDNKWGAMLCVPSILVISYSFPSSRSLPSDLPMKEKVRLDLGLMFGKKWYLRQQSHIDSTLVI